MDTLKHTFFPELGAVRRGKVRDVYEVQDHLLMVASDRISVFDRVLPEPIPDKGRVLTALSLFWFEQTKDIVQNHLIRPIDPNALLVKRCTPIPIEVIVRGYLAGSLAREYAAGSRIKCGVSLPDGLQRNDALPHPVITPTTKSHNAHDEDITREQLIERGLVSKELYERIEKVALQLYQRGQQLAASRGLILVDTKYEFGLDAQGQLVLIDEIHTPDSSRYWNSQEYTLGQMRPLDKELVREWLRARGFSGEASPPPLAEEVIQSARSSYRALYAMLTGRELAQEEGSVAHRLLRHLRQAKVLRGQFVLLLSGSEKDAAHVEKITSPLRENQVPYLSIVASAHKQPLRVWELIEEYNACLEPLVCITVAGRSNALSGMVAAHLRWPVIACPVFKDFGDYLTNIHSSLQMPSAVPVMTVLEPHNAALAAMRILHAMGGDA